MRTPRSSTPVGGRKKRRRRECTNCQKRFTTFEVVERPLLMVVKRDGSFEPFDRQKLIAGIYSAVKSVRFRWMRFPGWWMRSRITTQTK